MKIHSSAPEAIISNVETQGEFRIKNSAKAFSILSSGLYSNKIKAIVRELSCNAVDSHVEAKKADVPFNVHLPNQLEPFFSVEDFGIGLDHEGVTQLYTTYFESTKQDSNEYIGALGLGSKSPFSYTDNFTVTATKDAVRRIYTAYIGDSGCPSIALMAQFVLLEKNPCNGVEVKFAVTERWDYQKFQNEAEEVFKWFKIKPLVTGNSGYSHREINYKEKDLCPGVHILNDRGYGVKAIAIQGNIAYPINLPEDVDVDKYKELLQAPLMITFDIGELDIAASREELSYIPLTVNSIKKRLDEIATSLGKYVVKEVRPYRNKWLRAYRLKKLWNTELFRPSIRQYVDKGGCNIVTMSQWGGCDVNDVYLDIAKLERRGVTVKGYQVSHQWNGTVVRDNKPDRHSKKDKRGYYKSIHNIPFTKKIHFVINDEKRGAMARIKYHYKHSGDKSAEYVYLIDMDDTVVDKKTEIKRIMKTIHNPDIYAKIKTVSQLIKKDPVKAISTGLLSLDRGYRRGYSESYYWEKEKDFEHDVNTTYHYIPMSNYTALGNDSEPIPNFLNTFWPKVKESSILFGTNSIMGVRKSYISTVEPLKNWVNIMDVIESKLQNIKTEDIALYAYKEVIDSELINCYTIDQIDSLDDDSLFKQFLLKVKDCLDISSADEKLRALRHLLRYYNINLDYEQEVENVRKQYTELRVVYPMCNFVSGSYNGARDSETAKQLIDYIKLVDNTRSNIND